MVQAIRNCLRDEMVSHPDIVLFGQDIGRKGGVFKATDGLLAEFGPRRVVDTPIAEAAIAGVAIGAAMMGLRPVAEFQFADYMHPAFDQIVNQAATMRWRSAGTWGVPVVFRAPIGAGVRGGVYHSQSVEAFYCHVPGLKVVVPSNPCDAAGLLRSAIADDDPVLFFEHKALYRSERAMVARDEAIAIGEGRIERSGRDLTIITYGIGVPQAVQAASMLSDRGIEVEIVDLRTLAPLDLNLIAEAVRKTGRVLIVHEANRTLGIGAEVAAFVADELFMDLDAPVRRLAGDNCHLSYNEAEEAAIIPNVDRICVAAEALAHF